MSRMRPYIDVVLSSVLLLSNLFSCNPVYSQTAAVKTAGRDESALSKPGPNAEFLKRLPAKPVRVIVALGGGGCKSVAQVGVLRALEENGIPIDGIIGTSMGAAVGALYSSGCSTEQIEDLFVNGDIYRAAQVHLKLRALAHMFASMAAKLHLKKNSGGLTASKGYYRLLKDSLAEDFDQLKIPFGAVATNLTDGQTEVLSKGDLPLCVLASNTVPAIMRPVKIGEKLYVDGGLKANLPVQMASNNSKDIIIAVTVDKAIGPEKNEKFRSIRNVIGRVSDIVLAASDKQQASHAEILIYPNCDKIPMLTKDRELLKEGLLAGESAAIRLMPEIKKLIAERGGLRQATGQQSAKVGELK